MLDFFQILTLLDQMLRGAAQCLTAMIAIAVSNGYRFGGRPVSVFLLQHYHFTKSLLHISRLVILDLSRSICCKIKGTNAPYGARCPIVERNTSSGSYARLRSSKRS